MARALDAGSEDAFTGRTSELRGKETDPQPDRVGFKQNLSVEPYLSDRSPLSQAFAQPRWLPPSVSDGSKLPPIIESHVIKWTVRSPDGPLDVMGLDSGHGLTVRR